MTDAPAVKDLWTRILEEKAAAEKAAAEKGSSPGAAAGEGEDGSGAPKPKVNIASGLETFLLFVGSKQCGKTSLIAQFLNRSKNDDAPKPTVALEYTFGRRSNTTSNSKDIAHIWELAGGGKLKDLMQVPLTPARLPNAAVVVVVDLSQPASALTHAIRLLQLVDGRVRECVAKMKKKVSTAKVVELQERAKARLGSNKDIDRIEVSIVPLVLVGAKYDKFQDLESSRRKPLLLALRYLAHSYGASLICTSTKNSTQLAYFRAMLNHFVFHTEAKKTAHLDPGKPLIVPCGADSFDAIGTAPGARRAQMDDGSIATRMQHWQKAVQTVFPPESGNTDADDQKDDEEDAAQWAEANVDAMRAQKREELEVYKKEALAKLRLEAEANRPRKAKAGGQRRRRKGRAGAGGAGAGAGAGAAGSRSRQRG